MFKGVKQTKEHIAKRVESRKASGGYIMPEERKKRISKSLAGKVGNNKGRTWRIKDTSKMHHYGSNNPCWRGGITPLYNKIYNSFEYRLWRSDVFKRDWYRCQNCGVIGKNLRPHHIKTLREIIGEYNIKTIKDALACAELWDINNGITLCQSCHRILHKKIKGRS